MASKEEEEEERRRREALEAAAKGNKDDKKDGDKKDGDKRDSNSNQESNQQSENKQRLSRDQNELANIVKQNSDASKINLGGGDLNGVLNEAANRGNEEGAEIQDVAERTGNLVDIASYANLLNKGVDMFSKYNPKALLQSAGAVNSADGNLMKLSRSLIRGTLGTGKGPSGGMPKAAGLATVGNIGSEVFRAFDKEERSGFEALGEGIGDYFGNLFYGDTSQQAITPQELEAIRGGKNPNKPITETVNNTSTAPFNPSTGYGGSSEVVTGYESMKPKSQGELDALARDDIAAQFEGMSSIKGSDQMRGYLKGSSANGDPLQSRVMTPQEVAAFNERLYLSGTPSYSGTPQEGMNPALDSNGELVYANNIAQNQLRRSTQAPQATQAPQTSKQIEAQGNFADARDNGTITPDKIRAAEEYAASMGREFDPEMGYTSEFDPSILAKYNAERDASQQGGQYGGQQNIQQAQGRSSYATESAAREARMDARPDFGSAFMRNAYGELVNVTDETRAQRDIVTGLKQEARAAGYSPQQTRAYVADKLKERQQADEDRVTQTSMDELNITRGQIDLQSKIAEMMPKPDEMSREDYFGFVKGLSSMGIKVDPQTGNLTSVEEKFLRPNGEINLGPDSDLFQKISQMDGGESFLAAPKDVKEFASNQPAGARVRATDGTQRVWEVQEDGDLVQVL